MTARTHKNIRKRSHAPVPVPGQIAFGIMSVFSLLLILRNAELAISSMSVGIRLCVNTVIPSLFPFMVLSELLVSANVLSSAGHWLSRPFHALFGIGGESGCAVLLGWLCGFPIGAKSALALCKQGKIDQTELEHVLTFSNIPSSGFLISAVGNALLQNRTFGILLYGITLFSALLIGIAGRGFRRRQNAPPPSSAPRSLLPTASPRGIRCFTEAVTSSALSLLSVCAFVVFFSALLGTLEQLLLPLSLSPAFSAVCFGCFELTGGVAKASLCPSPVAEYLCAWMSGWSGLSVHFQMMSLCGNQTISFRPYFLAKFAHGILNVLLLWGCHFLFGDLF